jgi:uncharacterized protein DUF4136
MARTGRTLRNTVFAVLVALVGGCVTVHATKSAGTDPARYRTFAWYESVIATRQQRDFWRSPAGDLVRARIARDLTARGMREVADHPDVLVTFKTNLEEKMDAQDWAYPRLGWGAPTGVTYDVYTQGTLVIDFLEPATRQLLWRGTATSVIERPHSPDMRKLALAVDRVMRRF